MRNNAMTAIIDEGFKKLQHFWLLMKERKASIIIFHDAQKRILLQKRAPNYFGAEWAFFGGGINQGETPEQAVVRETKEELGHDLTEHSPIGTFRNQQTQDFVVELHAYIAPLRNHLGSFVLGEGEGMQLFTLEEALKLRMYPGDDRVINKLKEIL
jgi:mutator protein MutT